MNRHPKHPLLIKPTCNKSSGDASKRPRLRRRKRKSSNQEKEKEPSGASTMATLIEHVEEAGANRARHTKDVAKAGLGRPAEALFSLVAQQAQANK